MILVHIISESQQQAVDIIEILMGKKLLLNAGISKKTVFRHKAENGILERQKQILVIGKTKALLFASINLELKKHFSGHMPMLYAVPIIYMDAELSDHLRSSTAKV